MSFGIPYRTCQEVRRQFIDFFVQKSHTFVPSDPIVPTGGDPTLLFSNSGMNQFKGIFLGDQSKGLKRAVNSQKCLRVSGKHNDLEEVGRDGHHHTFFEMLGNWSFGDYGKKEAIIWAWELLTQVWHMPKDRLFVTIYEDDDEAAALWKTYTDVPENRILRFTKENFWEMGPCGPCGPCSEIHFDMGDLATQEETYKDPQLGVNGPNERYIEIWNLVFMQKERLKDGSLLDLPARHVDTGSGLERICRIIQGVQSNYETDLFFPIIEEVAKISQTPYDQGPNGTPHRVIADHIRALTVAIADGVLPQNEGRGYVIRRILRRACRFAYHLGQEKPFLYTLVSKVATILGDAYPELERQKEYVSQVIQGEEERFLRTLGHGLTRLDKLIQDLKHKHQSQIPGDEVFLFHDTFGFPSDLTRMIGEENGLSIDEAKFLECMNDQKTRARKQAKFDDVLGQDRNWTIWNEDKTSFFVEYEESSTSVQIKRYTWVQEELMLVLDQSPFYAQGGGQKGDQGCLKSAKGEIQILDTFKLFDMQIHKGSLIWGTLDEGTVWTAQVDSESRKNTEKNHSATHLLQSALIHVLGSHVAQQGSAVDSIGLRFDFNHSRSLTKAELLAVEDWVNHRIQENIPVKPQIMTMDQAKAIGAMALFGEKYSDQVRVVQMDRASIELCGGTHVKATGEIGVFRILSEGSVASGVRRIEAVTGWKAFSRLRQDSQALADLGLSAQTLKDQWTILKQELKELQNKDKQYRTMAFHEKIAQAVQSHIQKGSSSLCFLSLSDQDVTDSDLLSLLPDILSKAFANGPSFVLYHNHQNQAVSFFYILGTNLKGDSLHAGNTLRQWAEGLGFKAGGQKDWARGGGVLPNGTSIEDIKTNFLANARQHKTHTDGPPK